MLLLGNTKLGKKIWHFSLPAIETCPGRSPTCSRECYAMRYRYKTDSVNRSLWMQYERSKQDNFVRRMLMFIELNVCDLVRLHVAGDFYDEVYIQKWFEIVEQAPAAKFYTYTRSWAVPDYFDPLVALGRLPNMDLWFSFDRDMPAPPATKGVRTAYLSVNPEDQPPKGTNLVFRDYKKPPARFLNNVRVCSYEDGFPEKTSCSKCRLCYANAQIEQHPQEIELCLLT